MLCEKKQATIKCKECYNDLKSSFLKFCYNCEKNLHDTVEKRGHKKELIPYSGLYFTK